MGKPWKDYWSRNVSKNTAVPHVNCHMLITLPKTFDPFQNSSSPL